MENSENAILLIHNYLYISFGTQTRAAKFHLQIFVNIICIIFAYMIYSFSKGDLVMTIGEKIGFYAKQKNITLRRLASESEINYNTLYAIVSRKSNRVSDENLIKIAEVLEIPVEQFGADASVTESDAPTDAEIKLSATISSIIGLSTGKEKEDKLYLINSFLEANAGLIKNIYAAMSTKKAEE